MRAGCRRLCQCGSTSHRVHRLISISTDACRVGSHVRRVSPIHRTGAALPQVVPRRPPPAGATPRACLRLPSANCQLPTAISHRPSAIHHDPTAQHTASCPPAAIIAPSPRMFRHASPPLPDALFFQRLKELLKSLEKNAAQLFTPAAGPQTASPGSPKTERLHQLPPRTPRPLSVTHNSAAARPRETGPRGFSNSTQIFADLADQHGFRRVFLKRRQRRGRIDSGAHVVDTQESNQRKSVQSVVIRVPFESLGEPLNRESRDVCKRQPSTLVPRLSTLAHDPSSLPLR